MKTIYKPQTEWLPPESFPDLSKYDEIAIDLETRDPNLKTMGSGSVTGRGNIVGIAVAVHDWSGYYPYDMKVVEIWTMEKLQDGYKMY